jgi:SAM-dependent methyltransferase
VHIKQYVPKPVKRILQYSYDAWFDLADFLLGRRHPMVPARRHTFIGRGDFIADGNAFLKTLIQLTGLTPVGQVLDIGSGQGRMSLPLTGFLSKEGGYTGLEIVKSGVDWCEQAYVAHENFTFIHADVFNSYYNPGGQYQSSDYPFPFPDDEFDVIFLASVFTHMHPVDVAHYLDEIARCLKPGGRCLASFFLLGHESRAAISRGESSVAFSFPVDEHSLSATEVDPENAIAIDENFIRLAYEKSGLKIEGEIQRGSWSTNLPALSLQDMVIASAG